MRVLIIAAMLAATARRGRRCGMALLMVATSVATPQLRGVELRERLDEALSGFVAEPSFGSFKVLVNCPLAESELSGRVFRCVVLASADENSVVAGGELIERWFGDGKVRAFAR